MLLKGNCLETLKTLADNSVDSIVTDPPYELGFMGKTWDASGIAYNQDLWAECLRVLKPGGHLLAFSGSRTYHRMTVAIEDAGFEIRDQIMWLYGSGFPKSLDVSKAIDKAAGAEREVVGSSDNGIAGGTGKHAGQEKSYRFAGEFEITAPATPEAQRWQGWGTALKPAHEPICVARKPLTGTVASNVLEWGTGALNIDGSRVGTADGFGGGTKATSGFVNGYEGDGFVASTQGRWPANVIHDGSDEVLAGFPTSKSAAGTFTITKSGGNTWDRADKGMFDAGRSSTFEGYGDEGSAARFFYCAKASKSERNAGLEPCRCDKLSAWAKEDQPAPPQAGTELLAKRDTDASGTPLSDDSEWNTSLSGKGPTDWSPMAIKSTTSTTTNSTTDWKTSNSSAPLNTSASTRGANLGTVSGGNLATFAGSSSQSEPSIGISAERAGHSTGDADPATSAESLPASNKGDLFCPKCGGLKGGHPTVKPLALMRYLVKLVTPPHGTVLDPFLGSGSTAVACVLEGFDWIGCEMTEDYWPIIEARVAWAEAQPRTLL